MSRVFSANPDQERLLREGGGGLCVPHTARDFAQAVSRLLIDEPLRRAMASSGSRQSGHQPPPGRHQVIGPGKTTDAIAPV